MVTLSGEEISCLRICLHQRRAVEDRHIEEGVLIHYTRLVILQNRTLGHLVINQSAHHSGKQCKG